MPRRRIRSIELPTWALIAAIYGGWLAVTFNYQVLPWWAVLLAGAWFTAWHMSLQHEVLHGHPTRSQMVNDLIGGVPLNLWLPYEIYRIEHLRHHREPYLTDPLEDTESYYLTPDQWARRGRLHRALTVLCNTMAGRILIGPARSIIAFLIREAGRVWRGEGRARAIWARHLAACAAVVWWLVVVCRMPLWAYAILVIYPAYMLQLIRSFAEHRAASLPAHRTAIVENAPILGLLFLHNNLHVVHHQRPNLPWYEILRLYRAHRDALIAGNGGLVYDGYVDVARQHLFTPHHRPVHPGA